MGEWWRGGVIYQIYPRSFQDSNGDGIGDLEGMTRRLDHIARLGADAIWLSPIFASPMDDMGYDVSDYEAVDPVFGDLKAFDALVARAHDLGLKVMIDQVLNHSSDRHAWFQESRKSRDNPKADWYVWADPKKDGTPPNNWLSVFGGPAWEWNPSRGQYYLHNFLATQPDLNFFNPEVQEAMLRILRFWLDRGVDGFRFDTVNFFFHDKKLRDDPAERRKKNAPPEYNPYNMMDHIHSKSRPENIAFLKRIRKLMDEYPGTTTVGEVGEAPRHAVEVMAAYTSGGDKLHMCYSFDMLGPDFTAAHFRKTIEGFFEAAPDGWPAWSFSNHDVMRQVSRWADHAANPDDFARLCAALLLALKGSVCIYQGEELGLPEADLEYEEITDPQGKRFWPDHKGRDGCRTPIPWEAGDAPNGFTTGKPWLPIKPEHSARNVAEQESAPRSVLAFYREMLAWRRRHTALVDGAIEFIKTSEPVLAFRRSAPEGAFVCVFNLSPQAQTLARKHLPGNVELTDIVQGAAMGKKKLELGPNGFAILSVGQD
ncbi:MAG TPA: alpha-glucosidase family protein [Devosiaceae bacterium]